MKNIVAKKTYIITFCLVLIVALIPFDTGAKSLHSEHEDHMPAWTMKCTTLEDLDLSKDQLLAINKFNSHYKGLIMESYHAGMLQKIEIRSLLRNSDADEKIILEKFSSYVKMREQLFDQMMEYQIRIRNILTSDQRRNWCTLMGSPDFHGGW